MKSILKNDVKRTVHFKHIIYVSRKPPLRREIAKPLH